MKLGEMAFLSAVALIPLVAGVDARGERLGTAFTYQGQLKQGSVPVSGVIDLEFTLWDAQAGGTLIDMDIIEGTIVLNGMFTVSLDYGANVFDGSAYWIEVSIRSPAGVGEYVPLAPRHPIAPTPYAIALPGLRTQQNDTSPSLIGGHAGNAVEVNVVGAAIGGGGAELEAGAPQPHQVTDNFGTIGGGLGNTVGDSDTNPASAEAATVGGGVGNQAGHRWATIAGGAFNIATGSSATVGGGYNNQATLTYATVAGGLLNEAKRSGVAIGGGRENVASGENSTVSGGRGNTVAASGSGAVIGGGTSNQAINNLATIGGGDDNEATGSGATIDGGRHNHASGYNASVGGGAAHIASGSHSVVPGGFSNVAGGDYSLAGGYRAMVRDAATTGDPGGDEGTFVWADSTTPFQDYFTSTGPNQFLIQASGGVGIGTNSPSNALSVAGHADFSGFLGIGTATPTANLDVVSQSTLSTAVNVMNTSSAQRFLFQVNGANPGGQNREGNFEIWGFGANLTYNVLTATADGKVGVNTYAPRNAFSVDGVADFNGLVGIGTSTPVANLDVVSAHPQATGLNIMNNSSAQRFLFQVNGSAPGGPAREGNLEIWGTGLGGNHNVFTATPAGKVGIGTSNPANALSVVGAADFSDRVGIGTASPGYSVPSSKLEVFGGHIAVSNNYGVFSSNAAGDAIGAGFDTGNNDTLDLYAGGGKRVRIASSGEVGIGTDNPSNTLSVAGTADFNGRVGIGTADPGSVITDAMLEVADGHIALSHGYGVLSANSAGNGTGAGFDTLNNDSLDLWAGGAARVRLNEVGQLGVGTTSPSFRLQSVHTSTGNVTYPLQIANQGNAAGTTVGMLFQVDEGAVRGKGAIAYERKTTFNRGDLHFLQNNAANLENPTLGDAVMTIRNAGWIGMGTTAPVSQLDITSNNTNWTGVNIKNLTSDQRYLFQVNGTQPDVTRAGNLEIWGTSSTANHNILTATPEGAIGIGRTDPVHPFQVGKTTANGNGAHVTAGGVWTNSSDRNSKENFEPVDKRSILAKVSELPITKWRYKGEDDAIHHIGPVAQDFHAAFGLGGSDKHIGTLDADGVTLAAIQGLHEVVREKDAEIRALRIESTLLHDRLEKLEAKVLEVCTRNDRNAR